ncbi:Uncharacterised protein [Mycobacterium tuberculosis]|nr:Uncharacterised protein [Mycobacterium tuberculosis]
MIGAVVTLQVKALAAIHGGAPTLIMAAAFFYPLVEIVLQGGDFVRRQHVFDHQETVALELFDVRLRDHFSFPER